MPNIASVLKDEIVRLARKELRSETESLKKANARYRSDIAALKKRLAALEQQLSRSARRSAPPEAAEPPAEAGNGVRFSAKGLRTRRARLGLSAADFGALIGVSGQTIYNWEAETTRPREAQLRAIAELRGLGKKAIAARLQSASA